MPRSMPTTVPTSSFFSSSSAQTAPSASSVNSRSLIPTAGLRPPTERPPVTQRRRHVRGRPPSALPAPQPSLPRPITPRPHPIFPRPQPPSPPSPAQPRGPYRARPALTVQTRRAPISAEPPGRAARPFIPSVTPSWSLPIGCRALAGASPLAGCYQAGLPRLASPARPLRRARRAPLAPPYWFHPPAAATEKREPSGALPLAGRDHGRGAGWGGPLLEVSMVTGREE